MAQGDWSSVFGWPVIGIQATLLPDGRVLTFGTNQNGQQGAMHIFDVWDPVTNTHTTLEHGVHTDLFCSAAIVVPETGEVLIAGGDTRPFATLNNGVIDVNSFDYMTDELHPSSTGDMTYGRWYPTSLTLANGKILVLGGRDGVGNGVATPELYTPGVGWTTLDGASDKGFGSGWYYPTAWVSSSGRVVTISTVGTAGKSSVVSIDASGNGDVLDTVATPFKKRQDQPAIMYDTDKVLVIAADNSAWIVDFSSLKPKFTKTATPAGDHYWANMTLLADGTVLLTGGSDTPNKLTGVNYVAAIWNPDTGVWKYDDSAAVARLYHSTTILLPDATVLSVGGGAPGPLTNLNGEIYKPGYLFNADGTEATRPKIVSAPTELKQGQDFVVSVDNPYSITELKLVKFGSSTHGFNPESRMVELKFSVGADGKLHIDMPGNANTVLPGYWMLFAFNNKGTPSVASTIHIETGGELYPRGFGSFATANGSATYDGASNAVTLTKGANEQGNVMSNDALNLEKNFVITAQIKFQAKDAGTGGISFVLHNDPVKGDAVGYGYGAGGAYGIANGLAIEFDVSNDGARYRDIAADHTSFIDTDSAITKMQITGAKALPNLENGQWHTIQIRWTAATKSLVYTIDGKVAGTLTEDIAKAYFGGSSHAYYGFTGSTGNVGSYQQVRVTNVTGEVMKITATTQSHDMDMGGGGTHDMNEDMFSRAHMTDYMQLAGGARYNENTGITTLTQNAAQKTAAMMSECRVDLTSDFWLDFDVFLGTKDKGGDGLGFVLHNDPTGDRALGRGGEGLGMAGIRYGLGIEFDTYNSGGKSGDIANDHTRFIDTDKANPAKNLTKAVDLGNIEDGYWHSVRVMWDASSKTLSYTFDGKLMGTMTKDISAAYLAGSKLAYFGFTAANGGASNLHQVRLNDGSGVFTDSARDHLVNPVDPAMVTVGSAGYDRAGGAIQLTPDTAKKVGGVISEGQIDLTHNFEIAFDIFLGSKDKGGDGMAFVIHNDPRGNQALGTSSAGFGAAGIANGIAIEFDTYNQGALFKDIADDHTNFFDTDAPLATRNLTAAVSLGNKEDGLWHSVVIKWNAEAQTMWYGIDNKFAGVLKADVIHDFLGGSDTGYFGVTGANGGASNLHLVRMVYVDAIIA